MGYTPSMNKEPRMNDRDLKTLARLRRNEQVADLRDGRKRRAVTQPDKRKTSSKSACRKGNW